MFLPLPGGEGRGEVDVKLIFVLNIRPHPGLLPREKENYFQIVGEAMMREFSRAVR
jgi:hypothetical protein